MMSNIVKLWIEDRPRRDSSGAVRAQADLIDVEALRAVWRLMITELRELEDQLSKLKLVTDSETRSPGKEQLTKSIAQIEIDIQEALAKWVTATDLLLQSLLAR